MIFDKNIPKMKDAVDGNKILFSTRHIKSIVPKLSEDYKGSVCWHGCDKVSVLGSEGNLSGGGGS